MSRPQTERCQSEVLQHLYTSPNSSFGVETMKKRGCGYNVCFAITTWVSFPVSVVRRRCGSANLILLLFRATIHNKEEKAAFAKRLVTFVPSCNAKTHQTVNLTSALTVPETARLRTSKLKIKEMWCDDYIQRESGFWLCSLAKK